MAEAWKTFSRLKKDGKETSGVNLISMSDWENYCKMLLTENRKEFEVHET